MSDPGSDSDVHLSTFIVLHTEKITVEVEVQYYEAMQGNKVRERGGESES